MNKNKKEKVTLSVMADYSGKARHSSPKQTLELVLKAITSGEVDPDKILILTLDTKDGAYNIIRYTAGLQSSDVLAVCEIAKVKILQRMGYIPDDE